MPCGRLFLMFLSICTLIAMPAAAPAHAEPTFVFLRGFQDPKNFEAKLQSCVSQFKAAGGLSANILKQLDGAEVVVYYQKGGADTANPNPGGDSTGHILYLGWDSNLSGYYPDKAPKNPCAALLHELEHAARYFTGKECTGPADGNKAAYQYDEKLGSRAENFWLYRLHLSPQRTSYPFYGESLPLDRWTRFPASPNFPVPAPPPCSRICTQARAKISRPAAPALPACTRCIRFNQNGCADFRGGIYSGGDHRRVAAGSLRIIVGDLGYCQGRLPCEFKNCYVCPHLDTAFPLGATVTAIAAPGKDSRFARWGAGACKGQGQTCTFTAKKDSCISAQFLLINPTAPPQSLPAVACPEDP
ncbi:MAG TPA: hypothetical protein VFG05_11625 [Methylocella sp.]|nr:hypothetical protein [Methylocella sp.]